MERKYDAVFIIKNDDEIINDIITTINYLVEEENCKIIKKEKIGIKKLAYEIKGEKQGYYYFINFKTLSDKDNIINTIRAKMNTIHEIIKYQIIRNEEI